LVFWAVGGYQKQRYDLAQGLRRALGRKKPGRPPATTKKKTAEKKAPRPKRSRLRNMGRNSKKTALIGAQGKLGPFHRWEDVGVEREVRSPSLSDRKLRTEGTLARSQSQRKSLPSSLWSKNTGAASELGEEKMLISRSRPAPQGVKRREQRSHKRKKITRGTGSDEKIFGGLSHSNASPTSAYSPRRREKAKPRKRAEEVGVVSGGVSRASLSEKSRISSILKEKTKIPRGWEGP